MKAVGYIRVSKETQVQNGISLDTQEDKIRSWAQLNGYELNQIFRDDGISGKSVSGRPGIQIALDALEKDDALIIYSLSRLSRSVRDTLDLSDLLEKKGADLVSLSEKIDTTSAAGKMFFRLMAVLNEFERDQISERTKGVLAHKRKNQEKTGGLTPYGFSVESRNVSRANGKLGAVKFLVANENELNVAGMIVSMRTDKKLSYLQIAKKLNQETIRPKASHLWDQQKVRRVYLRASLPEPGQSVALPQATPEYPSPAPAA
jgi:site-specific DNA recombinase